MVMPPQPPLGGAVGELADASGTIQVASFGLSGGGASPCSGPAQASLKR
jgi:hypothetical protein